MDNKFANNLKYIRETFSISRDNLAQKIGVNTSTISRWENNIMGATIDNAADVSDALGVPLPDLIGKDLTNLSYEELLELNNNLLTLDDNKINYDKYPFLKIAQFKLLIDKLNNDENAQAQVNNKMNEIMEQIDEQLDNKE